MHSVAFDSTGAVVAAGCDVDSTRTGETVRVWNWNKAMVLFELPHPGAVRSVAFDPNGRSRRALALAVATE